MKMSMLFITSPAAQNLQKQPPEVFYKKGVLKNLVNCTRKHLCRSLF